MTESVPESPSGRVGPGPIRRGRRRIAIALPNLLTYGRIAAIPLIVAILFWPLDPVMRWWALGLYVVAGITDYLDGYLARAYAQQSSLGRMLDPIADKLLIAACLLMLVADGTIRSWSLWAAIVILSREILVSGLREFLAEVKISVPVSRLAKWKTAAQLVSVGFLIAGPAGDALLPAGWTRFIGLALLWIAAILTIITGYDYMKASVRHLVEED
ncbi:MAG: CDP-diacylglycerol--glycerol-3-phosphate 3-phosphatidyltransferase [Hyphomicrobiales bacterium]|uniref:CDP-diacylglycerol--glycerol-3-phosphate 3-phosphatidyltransferase n=1 Tax=Rhabdaerophilum calidifontis TaxID=2604328 RepID=UPI00123B86A6|nr:CDP-diacylglycerol--glycerol-3-phosphate 3-phosphatidyltransferase [Rhabdaerophilum calidifontis]MCA1951781.1 CDP-diacylglycerol--glycerol-3-phosphate 3-phosphatidyltransferase [Hyphomicrobiales bacterium]MCA1999275.1 CDP-diacylglycerol--glycerol-3-phosphate 3-phosphatidyltransferase [Hyphomicrobiales bacterium]